MQPDDDHIADRELLLDADGEVSGPRAARIREHLTGCWSCRTRQAELESAIADFVRMHYRKFDARVPHCEGSRALLRARMEEAAAAAAPKGRLWARRQWPRRLWPQHRLAWAASLVLLAALSGLLVRAPFHRRPEGEFAPNARWTPGAIRALDRNAVCSIPEPATLRPVAAPIAREVFSRYGIRAPRPQSYEVDYLIPPALGGSDDPRNLWPQPYSTGVWNARVKDALEERLRSLVCDGKLDLATAQRDLARDWIAAYKRYFRTDKPLLSHAAFVKDQPWE